MKVKKIVVKDAGGQTKTLELPKVSTVEFSIPAASWSGNAAGGRYPFQAQVEGTDFSAGKLPEVLLDDGSEDEAVKCGLSPKAETVEGALRFRAKKAPEGPISGTCHLFDM